ncbi:MAG: hypothetical protein FWG52_03475 [Proteobacteria bacterium]|jgi:hypothetical protein|nr:hypothetical protein [Pseudomonadota bacterium]
MAGHKKASVAWVSEALSGEPNSTVRPREFTAAMDLDFVRVHGPTNQSGVWMVRAEEIEGMSATQIQSYLGLKYAPTEISPVTVSQGAGMRVGRVGPQPQWGAPNPLGVQYELFDIIDTVLLVNVGLVWNKMSDAECWAANSESCAALVRTACRSGGRKIFQCKNKILHWKLERFALQG